MHGHFCLVHVFFHTALSCFGGLSSGEGGKPLHIVVGVNYEKGTTIDIKVQVSSIWAKECLLGYYHSHYLHNFI